MATGRQRQREAESRTMLPQARKAWDHLQLEEEKGLLEEVLGAAWPCQHPDSILASGAENKLQFFSVSAESDRTARLTRANHPRQPQPQAESWLKEADKPRGYSAGSHLLMIWQESQIFPREPKEIFPTRQCESLIT